MTINLKMPDIRELKPRITVFGCGGDGSARLSAGSASGTQRTAANAAHGDRNGRLHRTGRTMASGELLMTTGRRLTARFTSRFTLSFIDRPAADRHDMAASQNARPSKRQT